jgi:hypothetical protein
MKADTAERLAERALRMSDELNEMAREIEANEPGEEAVRLRLAIRKVMWTVYYELLRPTFDEHPSLEPEAAPQASPGAPRGARKRAASSAIGQKRRREARARR